MKDIISIIIPVYNAEKTINRCLKSVCNQTYKNLEIIIVDDGSTDSTNEILTSWKHKDSRVHIIQQNNRGAASARNIGMSAIKGAYFGFVDADDWVEPEFYEKLYNSAEKNRLDIVSASIREFYNGDIQKERVNSENSPVFSGVQAASYMFRYEEGIRTVVWDKLYRASVMKTLRFDEYVFAEDTLFNYGAMMRCSKYGRISYVGYNYDHRVSQTTGKAYDSRKLSNIYVSEKIQDYYESFKQKAKLSKMLRGQYDILEDAIKQYRITICRQVFHSMLSGYIGEYRQDYQIIRNSALKIDHKFVRGYLNKKDLCQWYLYLYFPMGFYIIYKTKRLVR